MLDEIYQQPDPAVAAMRGYRYKHGDRPLEGYTIQRAAGRGGFGEVYYALSDSGREVALKVVQAYEQIEIRGIAQCMNLKSPHLVTVFDVKEGSETDGHPIVIMEYVGGPSLRELLDQAPAGLGEQKAAFFLREIGKGLTYLHDCGIVHRDLKPANIFYENGYVKIGDYGLSKAISSSHRSGQTMTVGTVHYMAPEIGAGRYDRSIDIYALGVLLYEMHSGHPPFYGASAAEVLMKHLGTQVDVTGIAEPFATVIRKAMAKDPADRYETVQQMVEAVFGSEHVRQSVSCFSPENLTMVAGRVADRAGIFPRRGAGEPRAPSSRAYDLAADERDGDGGAACDTWADRIGAKLSRAARRVGHIGDGIAALIGARRRAPIPESVIALSAGGDPMPPRHRRLLMFVAIAGVAVVAGVFAPAPSSVGLVLLSTLGATLAITWAAKRLLPALQAETRFLRHLAVGGLASLMAVILSIPILHEVHRDHHHLEQTIGAMCLGFFLIDWNRRTRADREDRVSLGAFINCVLVGLILSGMFDAEPVAVIAILCGVSLAVQIASPWFPAAAAMAAARKVSDAAAPAREPVVGSSSASAENRKAATAESSSDVDTAWEKAPAKENGMSITRVNLGPLKIFSATPAAGVAAPQHRHDDEVYDVLGGLVRWPFALLGSVLLIAALLAACGLAFDIPGLLASGAFGPDPARDLQRGFGTVEWPRILRAIGGAGTFVLACLSAVTLMLVRRRRGVTHMTRVLPGIAILLAAPFILVWPGVIWRAVLPVGNSIDWGIIMDDFLGRITTMNAIRAAVAMTGALLLLLWPARRPGAAKKDPQPAPPSAPAPSSPAESTGH